MYRGHVRIWPNITIIVKVVLREILALTRLQYIVSSKKIIMQKNIVLSSTQMQVIGYISVLF